MGVRYSRTSPSPSGGRWTRCPSKGFFLRAHRQSRLLPVRPVRYVLYLQAGGDPSKLRHRPSYFRDKSPTCSRFQRARQRCRRARVPVCRHTRAPPCCPPAGRLTFAPAPWQLMRISALLDPSCSPFLRNAMQASALTATCDYLWSSIATFRCRWKRRWWARTRPTSSRSLCRQSPFRSQACR